MIFAHPHTADPIAPRTAPTLEGCALKETRVTAGVTGFIAEVRVEQVYQNPSAQALNLRYAFPLPHDAAVSAFQFSIDGKIIHGEVREKAAARAAFGQAKQSGQRAALMEQDRPNVFTLELANVPAGAEVKAVVTYLEALPYRSGEFELRIPTVVAPRYTPVGSAPVPSRIETAVPHTFSFDLTVDAGMPVESWHCKTHALEPRPAAANQLRFALTNDHANRDLVFGFRVGGAGIRLGLVTHRPDATQDGTFYLFAVPPADVASADVRGKELVFLLDRSGSMSGEKMRQAREALKACLRALNPSDAFSIYAFDDRCECFADAPVPFTQASLEAAERWLAAVDARGGTELLPSVKQAIGLHPDVNRQRVIVVITDGQVSNEDELIAYVRQNIGAARLYTVGVDTAVNTHILSKLASMGKGASQFVLPDDDIEGAIAGLCERFGSPLLTDPVADFGTVRVSDVAPHPLPDVMAGQVVAVAGRYRGAGQTDVVFSGQGPGRLLEHRVIVDYPRQDASNPVVEKIWARLMIDRHEDALLDDPGSPTVKQKIIALAVQHGLLSSQTSFLAIDERDPDPRSARTAIDHVVPQQLPEGWDAAAFGHAGGGALYNTFGSASCAPSPCPPAFEEFDALSSADTGSFSAPIFCDIAEEIPAAKPIARTDPLRELAKRQHADGSWGGSVDETADALLAFVAAGHTDRTGSYTAQIRRAIEWIDRLLDAGAPGTRKLLQAIAALAMATGSAQHQALEARLS